VAFRERGLSSLPAFASPLKSRIGRDFETQYDRPG
jgi:hypothetical protein